MADTEGSRRKRILVVATGSVAAVKLNDVVRAIDADVAVVLTSSAARFVHPLLTPYSAYKAGADGRGGSISNSIATFAEEIGIPSDDVKVLNVQVQVNTSGFDITSKAEPIDLQEGRAPWLVPVLMDSHEWDTYRQVKVDPVVHIKLRDWADMVLVCPASANTMAKLAFGMADNLATCVLRAWKLEPELLEGTESNSLLVAQHWETFDRICMSNAEFSESAKEAARDMARRVDSRVVLCPAMNTAMYEQPITQETVNRLMGPLFRYLIIKPQPKLLACGDYGDGALADPKDIAAIVNLYRS